MLLNVDGREILCPITAQDCCVFTFDQLLEKELTEKDGEEFIPEIEFSYDLMLSHNYIVLYFDSAMDWEVAKERFKLKDVKSGDPAEKCQKVGIARVLPGKDFI